MRRSAPAPLDGKQFPLMLTGGLRVTFADVACEPLPERLTALVSRLDEKQSPQKRGGETWVKRTRSGPC
jgi:hypothetical protein